ncbi:YfcE family phosphodiesterase [Desulfobacterales bacterium HSG17]|nr:YfcE family phosphodiesterase [Desulfobacterales bacterium HSG17]
MKIGIISDTHSKIKKAKKAINTLLDDGAEFFIHAGDIVEVEILDMLEACGKKYIAVYGNNDSHLVKFHNEYNLVQEPYYFKLADTKFKLMHLPFYMTGDTEIVISGHTHYFHAETKGDTFFLNSGEVCARKKPITEFAMLEVQKDTFLVTHYQKNENEKSFSQTDYSHKRSK